MDIFLSSLAGVGPVDAVFQFFEFLFHFGFLRFWVFFGVFTAFVDGIIGFFDLVQPLGEVSDAHGKFGLLLFVKTIVFVVFIVVK